MELNSLPPEESSEFDGTQFPLIASPYLARNTIFWSTFDRYSLLMTMALWTSDIILETFFAFDIRAALLLDASIDGNTQ